MPSRSIAVIPARGNSKRVPAKNKRYIAGKPMIGWVIEAAVLSGVFDDVVVDSEDAEILRIAEIFGATPHLRQPVHSQDHVQQNIPVTYALRHMQQMEQFSGKTWDYVCMLTSAAPMTTAEFIRKTHTAFIDSGKRQLYCIREEGHLRHAAKPVEGNPAQGLARLFDPSLVGVQSNDNVEKWYLPAPNLRWYKYEDMVNGDAKTFGGYYDEDTFGYVVPRELTVDIDEELDFRFAEMLLNQRRAREATTYEYQPD